MKKIASLLLALTLTFTGLMGNFGQIGMQTSFASSLGSVVINEVAWAGTADNSNDEWIELYNTTNQEIDLSGWVIEDDVTTKITIPSGKIAGRGYFLIEDSELSVNNVTADAILSLSLANAGDSLVLKNSTGLIVDTVNGSGGAFYAGDATTKATMERIDPKNFNDLAANWASAKSGNGALGRSSSAILGTPRSVNSNFGGQGAEISLGEEPLKVQPGQQFEVFAEVSSAVDLYAFGLELDYNENIFEFVSASEENFLKAGGKETAFSFANEDGKVILANVRLGNPPSGVDGSGKIAKVVFKAKAGASGKSELTFTGESFLSDSLGDLTAKFEPLEIEAGQILLDEITGLKAEQGVDRYSIKLSWDVDSDEAEKYLIKRKNQSGEFETLGEVSVSTPVYVDNRSLLIDYEYTYRVYAMSGETELTYAEILAKDSRGIRGDVNRSDKVDGRDLEKLARAYGSENGDEEYETLADLNFDGVVDGKDLLIMGGNFGKSYRP